MASVNLCLLSGIVESTPTTFDGGCSFKLKHQQTHQDYLQEAIVTVVTFGPLSEQVASSVTPGMRLFVEGKMRNRSEGKKYWTELHANKLSKI